MKTSIKLAILALIATASVSLAGTEYRLSYNGSNYRVGATYHQSHNHGYQAKRYVQSSHRRSYTPRTHYVQPKRYATSYRAPQRHYGSNRYVVAKSYNNYCRR